LNGSTLHYLAGVADLVKLDIEAAALSLRAEDGRISASYTANYAGGKRIAEYQGDTFLLSVSAGRFKTLVSMFDADDEVQCAVVGTEGDPGLRLRSKRMTTTLRIWGQAAGEPVAIKRRDAEFAFRMPVGELISELEIASAFIAETAAHGALMQGIKFDLDNGRLRLLASDRVSVLYESAIRVSGEGQGSVVLPAQDALLGARLVAEGDVIIAKGRDSDIVSFQGGNALFRSATFAGEWPDMSRVTQKRKAASTLTIESAALRNIVDGSKALDTGPDVDVNQGRNGRGAVLSIAGESGSFAVAVEGTLQTPRLRYDRAALSRVVKMGSVLTFNATEKNFEPTLITSEHRRCWVMTRI